MAGPIVGILLAAGRGTRFGGDKLLHPLPDGTPLALAAAAGLRAACDETIVVVRPGHLALIARMDAAGCRILACPEAAGGMGHSLAAGVRASPAAGGWVIALADMPYIAASTHRAVADRLRDGAAMAAPVHGGRRGHPVGFAACWQAALAALAGDTGARDLLATHAGQITLCPVDDTGIHRDIDTPADLA